MVKVRAQSVSRKVTWFGRVLAAGACAIGRRKCGARKGEQRRGGEKHKRPRLLDRNTPDLSTSTGRSTRKAAEEEEEEEEEAPKRKKKKNYLASDWQSQKT